LAADLAEGDFLDRTGMSPTRQAGHVQVFNENQVEFIHQATRERIYRSLACISHPRMRSGHPQSLLLASATSLLTPGKTTLLLP
jgi:hypothetical protein